MMLASWVLIFFPEEAYAMHIMEGFLPLKWSVFWTVAALPFFIAGLRSIQKTVKERPGLKLLLGLAGAFAFVLSALKLPSVTGSSSHMTGVGLGTILFGPVAMSVIGCIVLAFQALLLAHGGITTLGANTFSMAIAGPIVAYGVYRLLEKSGLPVWVAVFLAAALGDLTTYLVTSFQLGLAFPAETGGVAVSFVKFAAVFAFTQIPLAVCEGLLTVMVFNFLHSHCRQELRELSGISKEVGS
ncbi:MAG: energy-coupling factor ABC transporter permease [Bacillota bacterium]